MLGSAVKHAEENIDISPAGKGRLFAPKDTKKKTTHSWFVKD